MQFLWGEGQDKVVFPAILGLLHEHNLDNEKKEVEKDPEETLIKTADAYRSVARISQQQISDLLNVGRTKKRNQMEGSTVKHAKVSVAKALLYGFVNLSDPII